MLQGAEGQGRRDITWFWLNRIKSVCFVEFDHDREAVAARTELYDLTWPPTSHTPGRLKITFTTRDAANKTVAEEPVGVTRERDPVSARLGQIPGVGGLPGRDVGGGGMRGWGSLAEASAAARGGGGARGGMGVGARLGAVGPIGGIAGFGIAGGADAMRSARGGYEMGGAGRGWGSLAAGGSGPPQRGGMERGRSGNIDERLGSRDMGGRDERGSAASYDRPRESAPVIIYSPSLLFSILATCC